MSADICCDRGAGHGPGLYGPWIRVIFPGFPSCAVPTCSGRFRQRGRGGSNGGGGRVSYDLVAIFVRRGGRVGLELVLFLAAVPGGAPWPRLMGQDLPLVGVFGCGGYGGGVMCWAQMGGCTRAVCFG